MKTGSVYICFITGSTVSNEPGIFSECLKSNLSEVQPKYFFESENKKLLYDPSNMESFGKLWHSGLLFWDRQKSLGKIYGSALLGNASLHTEIFHIFEFRNHNSNSIGAFLSKTASDLDADYAFCHLVSDNNTNVTERQFTTFTSRELERSLPGVPWAAYYGKPYVELFKKSNLLNIPIEQSNEIGKSGVYCQLTSNIADCIESPSLIEERRNMVIQNLGAEAFRDPKKPRKKGLAPTFIEPIVYRADHH